MLGSERFDRIVSSDLSRARETAELIGAGAAIECDARWREFAFGDWEGLTWEQILQREPELDAHGAAAAKLYTPSGGETFEAVCERVRAALDALHGCERALVVTHAGPLHAVLHLLFGERRAEMEEAFGVRFVPASVTTVSLPRDEPAELIALNVAAG